MKYGLSDEVIAKIANVFARYPVIERAVLYGSRARGNYKQGSDIDFVLYGCALDTRCLRKIMDELDELLLPWTIDLSIFSQLENPALCEHIQRIGIIFYQSTDELVSKTIQ